MNGDTKKVSKHFSLPVEKVNMIFEEHYLQISQIIEAKMKSKELDKGIDDAISLITSHITELENNKETNLLTKGTINDITRLTDRMISLKQGFNNTYDVLVNKMNDQSLKTRSVEVLESGKVEDNTTYNENVETVFKQLKLTTRPIKATNIKTKEVLTFPSIRKAGEHFNANPDYIRQKMNSKTLYKDEWCFEDVNPVVKEDENKDE